MKVLQKSVKPVEQQSQQKQLEQPNEKENTQIFPVHNFQDIANLKKLLKSLRNEFK